MADRRPRQVPLVRIAVTGANSAVGRCLLTLPNSVRSGSVSFQACVRSERAAGQLPPLSEPDRIARIDYGDQDTLVPAFQSAAAVVHLPGVLVEGPGSSYEQANVETTRAVVAAAAKAEVAKLVLVSAIGADFSSHNRYYRSKGEAEALVRASGLAWTILRAPLVLGPGSEGTKATLRHARSGRAWMLGGGRNRQQPIAVSDLALAALRATDRERATGRTLDLVGPEVVRERELVERTARALGRPVSIRSVPIALARFAAALRTRLAGPGFSPDAIEVITADTALEPTAAAELGIELTPVDEMIRSGVVRGGNA